MPKAGKEGPARISDFTRRNEPHQRRKLTISFNLVQPTSLRVVCGLCMLLEPVLVAQESPDSSL